MPTPRFALRRPVLGAALVEAMATLLAVLATLASVRMFDPSSGAMVLAAVLCLSLARSQLDRDLRGRLEAAWTLPLLGLAATGVDLLLHRLPWAGALVFTAGIALSIWLRRFGRMARRAGSLIAVPLVAILTTPYAPHDSIAVAPQWLVPILIALLALLWVGVVHALFRVAGWLPPALAAQAAESVRESTLRPSPAARMALQMSTALACAFTLGFVCFGAHWAWPVLTAFIVNSGNRGRLDVLHKSLLRLGGALAGTLVAGLVPRWLYAHDSAAVALILGALFIAVWLRPIGYAWWALFVTLIVALLQDYLGAPSESALLLRLVGIASGAVLGVAAAWWVLPVRSHDVLRRRIGQALEGLSAALDPTQALRDDRALRRDLAAVEELAAPFRSGRLLLRAVQRDYPPSEWIDLLLACRADALRLVAAGETPPAVRRAVGTARKALLDPPRLASALAELRAALRTAASALG